MIQCGAFCLCTDPEVAQRALSSARRIPRKGTRVRARKSLGPGEEEEDGSHLVSLDFEGDGFPVVHGWRGDGDSDSGEYCMLAREEHGLEARRDFCGTRPLYVAKSRRWVASDHRFFPAEERELLPAGSRFLAPGGPAIPAQNGRGRFDGTFEEASKVLADLVQSSVRRRVEGKRKVAVAFSGGLDSSMVAHCAAKYTDVIACCAAAPGSKDGRTAGDAAASLGLESVKAEIDEAGVRRELSGLDLPFEPSPMDKGLWCLYSTAARLASESECDVILLGQLADELFGGYAKYEVELRRGGDPGKMMTEDVAQCATRGFIRDELACSLWCEPRFPFAEKELAVFGLSLPAPFKIREGVRKAVLREAALRIGLPDEVVNRPKKAAQYSSGVLRLVQSV